MSTASLDLTALHVMPADIARAGNAQASGERLIASAARVWHWASEVAGALSRDSRHALILQTAATRPTLAAAMRRAGNGNWA